MFFLSLHFFDSRNQSRFIFLLSHAYPVSIRCSNLYRSDVSPNNSSTIFGRKNSASSSKLFSSKNCSNTDSNKGIILPVKPQKFIDTMAFLLRSISTPSVDLAKNLLTVLEIAVRSMDLLKTAKLANCRIVSFGIVLKNVSVM